MLKSMEKIVGSFRVIIEPDKRVGTNEPCYSAFCPTLGIADDGDSIEEALTSIKEGIKCYIEALLKDGEAIPEPDNVAEGMVTSVVIDEMFKGRPPVYA